MRAFFTAILALTLFSGCSDEDISVVLAGPFGIEDCPDLPETLRWSFASFYRGPDGSGILRLQESPGPPNDGDHLVFSVADYADLRSRTRERLPLSVEPGLLRGALHLGSSCPATENTALMTVGDITFSRFDGRLDTPVEAEAAFRLVDARRPDVTLSEEINLRFSFVIRRYQPYQLFSTR